jgi:hypothetical protein
MAGRKPKAKTAAEKKAALDRERERLKKEAKRFGMVGRVADQYVANGLSRHRR